MDKLALNENDEKLLAYCFNEERNLSEISRELKIAVKNVSVRIDKLRAAGLINVTNYTSGKKGIRTIKGIKTVDYFFKILSELEKRGGEIKQSEFIHLLPFNTGDNQDIFQAPITLLFIQPPLVDKVVKLNDNGRQFLREYKKNKSNKV